MSTPNSRFLRAHAAVFLPFFLLAFTAFSQAQKQANIWHFGHKSGLDFSSGAPVQIASVIDAFEGCASLCDAQGNLLFYTNGGGAELGAIPNGARNGIIWNRNNQVMYDMGDSEGGGYSAAQSSLILPKQGAPNEYYLFTMDHHPSLLNPNNNRGLSYFVIDMTMNGGLGGVSLANQLVFKPATECLAAVLHQNGKDYWLLTVDQNTNDFVVVPVTQAGVQTPLNQPRQTTEQALLIKASPDGKFLFAANRLYRFDPANGTVTFLAMLPESNYYAFSFSPESRYLYTFSTGDGGFLVRYDLTAANVMNSKEQVADIGFVFPGGMQIAPDGNIYFVDLGEDQILAEVTGIGIIRCPDAPNTSVERGFFEMPAEPGTGSIFGLPNFADYIFQTIAQELETSLDTVKFCPGDTATLDANFSGATYLWTTGETAASITVSSEGNFAVTVSDACGREVAIRQFSVKHLSSGTQIDPAQELSLCTGETLVLQAPTGGDSYQWSSGETTPTLPVMVAGSFEVTVTYGCAVRQQLFAVAEVAAPELELQADFTQIPCEGETVRVTAVSKNASAFTWSTGATGASILALAGQAYTATAKNSCGETTQDIAIPAQSCCLVYVPNAFSPNNDGFNDEFSPFVEGCVLQGYQLQVFTRWGQLVFDSTNPSEFWDGTFKGKVLQPGVFVWLLSYRLASTEGVVEKHETGDVMLLR
jgi:gliding motility-associated-like protein